MKNLRVKSAVENERTEEKPQPKDKSSIVKIQDITKEYLSRMQEAVGRSNSSFELGKELASKPILKVAQHLRVGDLSVNKDKKSLSLLFPGKKVSAEQNREITPSKTISKKVDITMDGETLSFRNGTSEASELINLERKRLNRSYDNSVREDDEEDDRYDPATLKQKRAAAFIQRLKKETVEHQSLLKEMEKQAEERLKKIRGDIMDEKLRMERDREEERRKRIIEHIEMLKKASDVRKRALEKSEEENKKIKELSLDLLRSRRNKIKKFNQKKKKVKDNILKKIKDIHIPLPLMKIEEHEKKYEETLKKKEEARLKKIEDQEKKLNEMRKSWESQVFEKLMKRKKLEQKKVRMKLKAKKVYQRKIRDFDKVVKEKFRPKFDPVKRLEISIRNSSMKPRRIFPKKNKEVSETRSYTDVGLNEQLYEESVVLTPRSKGHSYLKQGNSKVDKKVLENLRELKKQKELMLKSKDYKQEDLAQLEEQIEKLLSQSTKKPRLSLPILPNANKNFSTSPVKSTKLTFSQEISNEELAKMKDRERRLKETIKNISAIKESELETGKNPSDLPEKMGRPKAVKTETFTTEQGSKFVLTPPNDIKSESPAFDTEVQKIHDIPSPKSENAVQLKKKNYLPEIKMKYRLEKKTTDWTKIIKHKRIPTEEKFSKVKELADEMDKKAREKQEVWNLKKHDKIVGEKVLFDVGDELAIDDLYFNSIKAKLSLLSDEITEKRMLLFSKAKNDKKEEVKPSNHLGERQKLKPIKGK